MRYLLLLFPMMAFAGGDITQSNDMNNQTGGDISITGDRAGRALAWSMGDVDIGQCLAHKGTLVYTWPTENVFCQAQWLIASGYVEAGEHMLCTKTKMKKLYADYDTCRSGLARVEAEEVPEPASPDIHDDSALIARLDALEAQRQQDTKAARVAAARAQAAAQKAEEAERDRREYAQQTLDELKQWK